MALVSEIKVRHDCSRCGGKEGNKSCYYCVAARDEFKGSIRKILDDTIGSQCLICDMKVNMDLRDTVIRHGDLYYLVCHICTANVRTTKLARRRALRELAKEAFNAGIELS